MTRAQWRRQFREAMRSALHADNVTCRASHKIHMLLGEAKISSLGLTDEDRKYLQERLAKINEAASDAYGFSPGQAMLQLSSFLGLVDP